jgi:hypothetical protein
MMIQSCIRESNYTVEAHVNPNGDIVPHGEYISSCPPRSAPIRGQKGLLINSSQRARHLSPFLVPNLRSSGSNTKSNPFPDFWSLYNEEPLDENHLPEANYSFLLGHTSPRVRCAAGASSARTPHRRHESSMLSLSGFQPPFAEHIVPVLGGPLWGGRFGDCDIVPAGEASRRDMSRQTRPLRAYQSPKPLAAAIVPAWCLPTTSTPSPLRNFPSFSASYRCTI